MRLLAPAALALGLFGVCAGSASALSCLPADPWFVETVRVDQSGVPGGVTIVGEEVARLKRDVRAGAPLVRIGNSTSTPVYLLVVGDVYRARYLPSDSEPPERFAAMPAGLMAAYKAQDGQAWWWGREAGPDWTFRAITWTQLGEVPIPRESREIAIGRARLAALAPGVENRNRSEPQRPADVQIPQAQRFQMMLLYGTASTGERLLPAPATVAYALNPDYDARRVNPGWCSENAGRFFTGILVGALVVVVAVVGGVAWLTLRLLRR